MTAKETDKEKSFLNESRYTIISERKSICNSVFLVMM